MGEKKIDSNSGVQANVGFDFQRNTCIYIFLEKYSALKDQNYFIMLEHYDDIVFGILNEKSELAEITTYQAKKSSTNWTTNKLYEIIQKICNSGVELLKDELKKSSSYSQLHHFITNNTISLDYKCSTSKKTEKLYVNETNESVKYSDLPVDCQTNLKKGNTNIKFDKDQLAQFPNLNFSFIDIGRNTKSQLELLSGKFKTVFGKLILDHDAARDTFIFNLKGIESTYNMGDQPKLKDVSKRLESSKINEILNILTTKNLALDMCRKKADKIYDELGINVVDALNFELDFENSLDHFKDKKQGEHQKIIKYIESKKPTFVSYTNDVNCIKYLHDDFLKYNSSLLSPTQLKAAIAAGYYQILLQK
ncbi:DUF4297 domain-containing protein [Elizabethkingia anophelis]|uniref:DUF4297 domain-containing protein n=1 Tax=Elizabethkingia anophelis TaxID=1117645 RepID=UPI0021A6A3C2|nr:hypothetical protein [Elizabethkingia anophelis]